MYDRIHPRHDVFLTDSPKPRLAPSFDNEPQVGVIDKTHFATDFFSLFRQKNPRTRRGEFHGSKTENSLLLVFISPPPHPSQTGEAAAEPAAG